MFGLIKGFISLMALITSLVVAIEQFNNLRRRFARKKYDSTMGG